MQCMARLITSGTMRSAGVQNRASKVALLEWYLRNYHLTVFELNTHSPQDKNINQLVHILLSRAETNTANNT